MKPKEGKIGLATIHKDIINVRKDIAKILKTTDNYVVKKIGGKYVVEALTE